MVKKIFYGLVVFIFFTSCVYASSSFNYLTKGHADTLYCQYNDNCTIEQTILSFNVSYSGDNKYLYNTSTTIYLNETKLNDTIINNINESSINATNFFGYLWVNIVSKPFNTLSSWFDVQSNILYINETKLNATIVAVSPTTSSNITFNPIIGFTTNTYNGNITNGSLIGYAGANNICKLEFPSYDNAHFCLKSEVLKTIASGNYSFTGTYWFQNGPPGYTANADDCAGWTNDDSTFLGPFWNWDGNAQAGYARLTNCAQTKKLMCCG